MKSQWTGFHGPLAPDIGRFLAYKRALNRRYDNEEKALRLLDHFLVERRVDAVGGITSELLDAFLASRSRTRPRSYNHLLGVVRRLFAWLVGQGVLPSSPLRARSRRETARRIPFLFNSDQARRLLAVSSELADNNRAPLRGPTYRTIFALLYGLGLRVGEVARLCCHHVDFERDLLVIRQTKYAKDRLVPFGPRIAELLRDFLALRGSGQPEAPLFSFCSGRHIHPGTISQTFHQLVPELDLPVPPGTAPPCVHSLRHSFAVATLLRWYRAGINPSDRLHHLATFLGHVDPASTAVYLTITTALLDEAGGRFERYAWAALEEAAP